MVDQEKIEAFRKLCKEYCEKNDFMLNPDKEHTDIALLGVLENEEKVGLKYCPCRVQIGDFSKDIELLCPCNFKTHKTWEDGKGCWCGLFVKK